MTTVILPCTCRSDYQDQRYGRGMRVHNVSGKHDPNTPPKKRCTVCGVLKT